MRKVIAAALVAGAVAAPATVMAAKPPVASFLTFFLTTVPEAVIGVGYFPASTEGLDQAKQNWLDAMCQ